MAILTIYFGLNVILNYSWLHISMLKGNLDEKILHFSWKTNLTLSNETNKVPKTTIPSNFCVLNQLKCFATKTKLDTSSLSLGDQKWKSGDKNNVFSWEN